ncbi:MAG: hypothetical protein U0871_27670 [Gemmataceae bacterium]
MPVFPLILHKTYREQGFFNVTVGFDGYIRREEGPMEIVLMADDQVETVRGHVNRTAQGNGTARVMGAVPLRNWFCTHCQIGEQLEVDILAPDSIRISR